MDPLSVTASVAGLIALVAKAAEITRELYNTVKQKPRVLKSLADDLAIFHAVLGDLGSRLADGGNEEEQAALKSVSASCERTVHKLQEHLISLREMSSKNLAHRLYSHSKYKAMMDEIEEMREDLAAFKLTLNIAIHLRVIKQSENIVTAANVNSLRIEIADLTAKTQRIRTSQPLHPIQEYINISETVLGKRTRDIAADDIESIKSFRGFADWLTSFSPKRPCQSFAGTIAKPVPNTISKDAKAVLRIRNLGPLPTRNNEASRSTTRVETIELAMADYFYTGIEALHQRGYKGVCGFRIGSQLLGPLSELGKPVPVYVTEGPSSYSLDWLEIHMDEPLEEFYDNFVRAEDKRKTGLTTRIRDNELEIRDEHFDTCTTISLNRTLRLPEDGVVYNLPGLFGQFPIINVDFLHGKLPEVMMRKSGVIVPIYSREAISIGIRSNQRRPARESLAIRVLSGGVNAISGLRADKATNARRQDHITSPAQKRLDGFLTAPDRGRSVVQQFVAMPTGEGYTAECQITGEEVVNGIQLIVAPPFAGRGKFFLDTGAGRIELAEQEKSSASLGFKPGTQLRMSGEDIESHYKTKHANFEDDDFLVPLQSFSRHYEYNFWGLSMPSTRPVRTHEVLWPILEQRSQFDSMELELEAVFEMTITVKEYPYHGDEDIRNATWSLSPFTPMEKLYELVSSEFNTDQLELRYGQTVLPRDGSMLHNVSADGGVITFRHWILPNMIRLEGEEPRPKPILSTWEMGLAPGSKTYQDVYADAEVNQWDWKKSQLLNVQILNAVAFESFTGISPPNPPFSFAAYVDAGIPFYHIMPKSGILSAETALKMETVSQIDFPKGVSKSTSIQGPKPVECVLCERMLADTILRPCNHVFCDECIQLKMRTRNGNFCSACGTLSSHQIQFSGPMEKPLLTNDTKITPPRPRVMTNARALRGPSETEFLSSIRRSAVSAAMDDLADAVSQQATVTGTPRAKESIMASNPQTSWHWRLTDDGKTPLQVAAEQNKEEIVEFLVKTTPETMTDARVALGLAAAAGHLGVVKLLAVPCLSYEPKPADFEVIQTHDALEMAAKSGKSDVVEYLLQKGFGPRKESIKKSALHLAAENGHIRIVRLLIDAGFDPNSTIKRPPVRSHYSNGRASPNGLGDDLELTPAALAARNGHGDVLQLLHSHGASMDIPSGCSGYRPIHEAAAEGKVEAVRCLLEIGVSATVPAGRSWNSRTPLDLAADGNHVEVARLLSQGSEPEAVQSAVQAAVQQGSTEVLDFFLEHGADANTKNSIGQSILHIAAARNSSDAHKTIAVLLKHGADITATDGDGCWSELPIHKSIKAQNLASFETLLSAGADIHAELPDGRTCLHLAAGVGAVDIGRRLLDEGLDPNHRAPNHIAYAGKDTTPLKAGLESLEGISSAFAGLLLSRGAVVHDLDLLRCILACRPRWHQNEVSKCALLLFPYFQPLLCQVEMVTTPAGTHGGATWVRELGDFVVSAFKGSPCEVETALEILTQVMVLSPPSVDCRVVRALLLHASRMKLMTLVDSIMQLLPPETCRAVAAGFRREASPKDPNLAFYVVQRYASLEEDEGDDDSMHNDEWRGDDWSDGESIVFNSD